MITVIIIIIIIIIITIVMIMIMINIYNAPFLCKYDQKQSCDWLTSMMFGA